MRVDPRTRRRRARRLPRRLDFPLVTHLRDTQVYVHCARDGLSVFDLPRSRAEQDWEQWKPLTRWIAKHARDNDAARTGWRSAANANGRREDGRFASA